MEKCRNFAPQEPVEEIMASYSGDIIPDNGDSVECCSSVTDYYICYEIASRSELKLFLPVGVEPGDIISIEILTLDPAKGYDNIKMPTRCDGRGRFIVTNASDDNQYIERISVRWV